MNGPATSAAPLELPAGIADRGNVVEAVGELAHADMADRIGGGAVRHDRAAPDEPVVGSASLLRHDHRPADLVERDGMDRCGGERRMNDVVAHTDLAPDHERQRETRSVVQALEDAMRRELDLVELPVKHYFSLTGKIHKYAQLNIMSKGELSVLTEDGVKRVKAPFTIVSPPGTKRVAYAHEDTIWTTIHGTEDTDLVQIESKLIAQNEQEYLEHCRLLEHKGETK
jgi:hypothetical protein